MVFSFFLLFLGVVLLYFILFYFISLFALLLMVLSCAMVGGFKYCVMRGIKEPVNASFLNLWVRWFFSGSTQHLKNVSADCISKKRFNLANHEFVMVLQYNQ